MPVDPAGKVELRASAEGLSLREGMPEIEWGTKGVKLVLVDEPQLTLRVVDATDGEPVERFGLRVNSGRSAPVIDRPGGVLTLRNLERRSIRLLVVPGDPVYAQSSAFEIDASDGGRLERTIRLHRQAETTIRVVSMDGEPVVGSEVQLLEPNGKTLPDVPPVPLNWPTRPFGGWGAFQQGGYTGANGELNLRGSPAARYRVMLRGPGHIPVTLDDVTLGGETNPLVVRVRRGATLLGRIRPQVLVDQIWDGMDPPRTPGDRIYGHWNPGVVLLNEDRSRAFPRGTGRSLLRPDGSFRITGIPAGTWTVVLWPLGRRQHVDVSQPIAIVDGARLEREFDLGQQYLRGVIEGRLLLNGTPVASPRVFLRDATTRNSGTGKTDANGRFRILLPPGRFGLRTNFPIVPPGTSGVSLTLADAVEEVAVERGKTVEQDFHLWSTRVRVLVLDADGKPKPGIVAYVGDFDTRTRRNPIRLPETGADGRAEGVVPTRTVRVWVPPRNLRTLEARLDIVRSQGLAALAGLLTISDEIALSRGGTTAEITIRLPKTAGY